MNEQEILPQFQKYLRERGIVPEKNIPYYACWASRFLSFGNKNEHLPLDIRIEQFLKERATRKPLADWQLRQAEEAVRLYSTQFLSGNTKALSPNTPEEKAPCNKDQNEMLAKMRELIRLKREGVGTATFKLFRSQFLFCLRDILPSSLSP